MQNLFYGSNWVELDAANTLTEVFIFLFVYGLLWVIWICSVFSYNDAKNLMSSYM